MSELENPEDLLRRIYDEEFGFLPTSRSMKPVHVANGTARRLLGTTADHRPLARILRQFVKNQTGGYLEERDSTAQILEAFPDLFSDQYGNAPTDEELTRFRALAKETLGADAAVFNDQASFTFSHKSMITTDVSDAGAGDFLAGLLVAGASTTPTLAADLIRRLLESDADPWTTIAWPVIEHAELREAPLSGASQIRADRLATLQAADSNGVLISPTLRKLRSRYEQLALYQDGHGSKLTMLRQIMLFGTFSIHVHMIHRANDVIADAPRPPILLDLFDGAKRSLREASAATLQAGFRVIEQLISHRISEHLGEHFADADGRISSEFPEAPQALGAAQFFDPDLAAVDPRTALTDAFWRAGYTAVGTKSEKGFPWHAMLGLGRRTGYLLPYDDRGRGGKEHKRYGVTAEFAEILVASTVRSDAPVDFDTFLDRLRDNFGIVVGRPVDFDIIRRNNLRENTKATRSISVSETDLRQNFLEFKQLILDIGLAKSYADGRTIVTLDEGRS